MRPGPAIVPALVGLRRHSGADRRTIVEYQEKLLRRLVRHAYANVPYYRELFDHAGVEPRDIRSLADLGRIPISRKADLRSRPVTDIVARGYDPRRLLTVHTSGSSGHPFTVYRTWRESALQYLFRVRALAAFGSGFRCRTAGVGLVRLRDVRDKKLAGRLLSALGIKRRIMIDGLQSPEMVAERLAEYQPETIVAMSGMLCRVAEYVIRERITSIRPRLIVPGGEVTTPRMRRRLEEAFGATVLETYASHEFPLLGWQCRQTGAFHVVDDGVIFEVVRNGAPVATGETGEVVATNLHAYAMPLIRYRLADIVTRGADQCACGQPFSTIHAVQGRLVDQFPLADGRVINPYEILIRTLRENDGWLAQYQLLQERRDRVVLRVVPIAAPNPERLKRMTLETQAFLGPQVEFEVLLVDDLPLDPSGKFRPMRSLVQEEPGPGV